MCPCSLTFENDNRLCYYYYYYYYYFFTWTAVNPHACTDPHLVWSCKMDAGEFEFVYHFNNHFNPFRLFLSLHVAKWKNVVILCLFVCIQNPIERKSILKRCKLFSNHSLKNSALLSFWGGVPVNRPTCLCIEKDSQFTYLITYDIFTFKVWFENNLHRSIMKVLYCAIGFCKETSEQRMKTFLSEQHATNRNKDSND